MKNKIWYYLLIAVFILISGCQKQEKFIFMGSPWISYGSMTDKDGNIYKTILIGKQTWMVENLKTTKYNDGTSIPFVSDATSWSTLSTPACCWQQNDPARKVTYGALYNWYTVNTGKLCHKGWHVPSDEEWMALTDYLGGENVAGGKLKESGFKHWYSPNTGATNEVAFSALPGGERLGGSDALFDNLRENGCWWTATYEGDLVATNRIMFDSSDNVQKFFFSKNSGLSVRCVWNY